MNKGKAFEKDFQEAAKNDELFVLRLHDTSLSWQHEKTSRFQPENPCDFLIYELPNLFAIECKSTCYKSLTIQRDIKDKTSKMIKAHQINSLVNFAQQEGVFAGFLFNFRDDEDISNNVTYWLSIQNFSKFLCENDKQSINKLDCIQYGAVIIEQKIKRTHYTYNIKKMLEDIRKEEIE